MSHAVTLPVYPWPRSGFPLGDSDLQPQATPGVPPRATRPAARRLPGRHGPRVLATPRGPTPPHPPARAAGAKRGRGRGRGSRVGPKPAGATGEGEEGGAGRARGGGAGRSGGGSRAARCGATRRPLDRRLARPSPPPPRLRRPPPSSRRRGLSPFPPGLPRSSVGAPALAVHSRAAVLPRPGNPRTLGLSVSAGARDLRARVADRGLPPPGRPAALLARKAGRRQGSAPGPCRTFRLRIEGRGPDQGADPLGRAAPFPPRFPSARRGFGSLPRHERGWAPFDSVLGLSAPTTRSAVEGPRAEARGPARRRHDRLALARARGLPNPAVVSRAGACPPGPVAPCLAAGPRSPTRAAPSSPEHQSLTRVKPSLSSKLRGFGLFFTPPSSLDWRALGLLRPLSKRHRRSCHCQT